jgi:hypothetical protein
MAGQWLDTVDRTVRSPEIAPPHEVCHIRPQHVPQAIDEVREFIKALDAVPKILMVTA